MKVMLMSFQAKMYVYLVWWMCCVDVGCQSESPKQQLLQVTQMQERQEADRKHQFMFASTSNRAPSRSKDLNIQISIEKAFKAEWLHHHIFRKGETAITSHLLPPLYFSFFSND